MSILTMCDMLFKKRVTFRTPRISTHTVSFCSYHTFDPVCHRRLKLVKAAASIRLMQSKIASSLNVVENVSFSWKP